MQLKKNLRIKSGIILLTLLVLAGCEEGPLGFDELDRGEFEVVQVIIEAEAFESYSNPQISLGGGAALILGKDSLTEARVLIAIDGLDSITEFDSTKLVLRKFTETGIPSTTLPITVYPVSADWEEEGCTWTLSDRYNKWNFEGGEFDSTDILYEFTIQDQEVRLKLDPDNLEQYNQGIIFVPQDEGFSYLGAYDGDTTFLPYLIGYRDDDSTRFSPAAGSDYYAQVKDISILKPYSAPTEDVLIGSGYPWRTFIGFSLDTLPDSVDVTSADLIMTYQSYFSPEDTLDFTCYRLIDDYDGRFSELSSFIGALDTALYPGDSLDFSLAGVVQFWVDEPDSNFGLVVAHSFREGSSTFGQEKRIYSLGYIQGTPQLVVTYTKPPRSRYEGGE